MTIMTKILAKIMMLPICIATTMGCEGFVGSEPEEVEIVHASSHADTKTVTSVWEALLSGEHAEEDAIDQLLAMPMDQAREARYRPADGAWSESTMSLVIGSQMIHMDRATFKPLTVQIKETARRRGSTEGDQILLRFEALLEGITESSADTTAVPLWITAMSLRSSTLENLSDTSSVKTKIERLQAKVRKRMEISPYELLASQS